MSRNILLYTHTYTGGVVTYLWHRVIGWLIWPSEFDATSQSYQSVTIISYLRTEALNKLHSFPKFFNLVILSNFLPLRYLDDKRQLPTCSYTYLTRHYIFQYLHPNPSWRSRRCDAYILKSWRLPSKMTIHVTLTKATISYSPRTVFIWASPLLTCVILTWFNHTSICRWVVTALGVFYKLWNIHLL